jgi:hypothetical protein
MFKMTSINNMSVRITCILVKAACSVGWWLMAGAGLF